MKSAHALFELAWESKALKLGRFTTKAGRLSPYFFNAGEFNTGVSLAQLGALYAQCIVQNNLHFDQLYGPAYKGIPLVASIAIALTAHGRNVPFSFNRKEAKDHGEGGQLIGAPLKGNVLIVDDVLSAGTSVRESVAIIQAHHATPSGLLIALDRQERGHAADDPRSAVTQVTEEYGFPVTAIASLDDLEQWLITMPEHTDYLSAIQAYRAQYGALL